MPALLVGELRRLLAAQGRHHPGHDHGEPVGAGVHDARLLEHRELLRPALHRLLGGVERPLHHLGDQRVLLLGRGVGAEPRGVHVREVLGHAVGHRAHRAQHRALGRLAHRVIGGVGRAGERGGHEHRIHQLAGARRQLLGGAAHDLREDHAAVAARAQQRGAGHGGHQLLAPDHVERLAAEPVELLEHGAQGHGHVVPRVAVGDREDVQVVDLGAAALELGERGGHDPAKADQALVGHVGSTPPPSGFRPRYRDGAASACEAQAVW